jgi:putative colanic acid biosynthesis UDP-glucose lipid carrier transferase
VNIRAQELGPRVPEALTLSDSPGVFSVKCLLFPIISVMTLILCLRLGSETLRGGYFLIAVLTFIAVSEFLGIAQISAIDSRQNGSVLIHIATRWFALMLFIGLVLYFSGLAPTLNRRLLALWAVVTPLALFLAQPIARYSLIRASAQRRPFRRAVIVGVTELGIGLERALRADVLLRTEIVGYFEDRNVARLSATPASPILGKTTDLAEYVARNRIDLVYISLPMKRDARILLMLDSLHDSTASIYFLPDLFAFNLIQARFDIVSGIPVLAVRETPFSGASGLLKRVSDVGIAAAATLLTLPLFMLVALAIRLDSPGPIFFKQKRYGLDGREILVYKFRSMSVTEDGKDRFTAATRRDSRVTRVGGFIRRTSLDELPQLFNVLEGSMSIVGPRPHPVAMNEHYRRAIPSYMVRHKVKPGITGWAQVNGYRGGDDLESMRKRIEFDLAYLRNWSLWLDLQILVKTIAVVWTDRHAY